MGETPTESTKLYEVTNRITGEKRLTAANTAQQACELQGWMIGDCFVILYRTRTGQYRGEPHGDLVAVPCAVCPYQYAECGKPAGVECPVTSDVPDFQEWLKKISRAHLCLHVGENMGKTNHRLHRKLIPFETALLELAPK